MGLWDQDKDILILIFQFPCDLLVFRDRKYVRKYNKICIEKQPLAQINGSQPGCTSKSIAGL